MNRLNFPKILGFFALALILALGNPELKADTGSLAEADALLKSPTLDLPQAVKALALLEEMLPQAGGAPAPLWARLAQASFIAGDLAEKAQRQKYYEKGRNYAELLRRERPSRVEGHYWLALNLAGLAEVGGRRQGFKLLPTILKELQRSLTIDETYDQAGAHRVLGRIYYEAPAWPLSVGDLNKSLRHLTAAVRLAPEVSTNHLFLAETLIRRGQPDQARGELERVLTSTRHAIHPRGLAEDQKEARRLLQEVGG